VKVDKRFIRLLFIILDFLAGVLAWHVFHYTRKNILNEAQEDFTFLWQSLAIGLFWVVFYALFGFYVDIFRKSRIKEFLITLAISLFGVVIIFLALLLDDVGVNIYTSYYKTLSAYFAIHFSIAVFFKMLMLSYSKRKIRNKSIQFNTLIIGSNAKAIEIYQELLAINYSQGLRFIGYVHVFDQTKNLLSEHLRHFGDFSNIPKLIRRCKIEHVIIAVEPSESKKIEEILNLIESPKVKVSIIPGLYNILVGSVKVNHVMGVPLVEINQQIIPVWQLVIKRLFDIAFSSTVLVLGSPMFLFCAIMVKMSSPGPIFFSQIRIGRGYKPFVIYKFRSMVEGSESNGPALSSDDDPRITKWGKFMRKTRMDEIPQFFNVLIGNMSIVGPRPERKYYADQILQKAPHYKHLWKVRPGITSMGQVKYGYAENVDEMVNRLPYDILYIENMSLAMDFRIILFTILIVIQGRGK
jgi:exopolysaccharide biosynthesis polyprenyl glycosylphosphotransferase